MSEPNPQRYRLTYEFVLRNKSDYPMVARELSSAIKATETFNMMISDSILIEKVDE